MTTLLSYVSSLPELTGKVYWDAVPVKSELYALLYEGIQGTLEAVTGNSDLVAKTVSVALYATPPSGSNLAAIRPTLMRLLAQIEYAVHHVKLDSDGVTPLKALHRAVTLPPMYDRSTAGYEAVVQFSAHLYRP